MNERDLWTCDAMEKFGGSFVKQLSILARMADANNLRIIKESWPTYWKEYEQKGIEMEEK